MSLFLNWKNYEGRSKERIVTNLFSYLSPRWYPINGIGTNIYHIFEMYSDHLSSSSLESQQVFRDTFIENVRNTPYEGRTYSKIYENFGLLFEVDKLFLQNYESYNYEDSLQSYRQQLRFLSEAFFKSPSIESIQRVGQSYTGMSPVVRESSKNVLGWKLQTITGSVLYEGNKLVILDVKVPGFDYIFPISPTASGSFLYTYSKLNYNTKLLGKKRYYSGMDNYIFTEDTGSVSFKSSIENSIYNVLKADIIPRFHYSDEFVYWRPSTGSIPLEAEDLFEVGEYLYNIKPIHSTDEIYLDSSYSSFSLYHKWSINSEVLELPDDYEDYRWYYDWSILVKNDCSYKMYMREYPSSDIPFTVYFKEYKSYLDPSPLLSQVSSSSISSTLGHWVFTSLNEGKDISVFNNNLIQTSSVPLISTYIKGREPLKVGYQLTSGSLTLHKTTIDDLDISENSFMWESWIYGVDMNMMLTSGGYFIFKREEGSNVNVSNTLVNDGYGFLINSDTQTFEFLVKEGITTTKVSGSVGLYMIEEPYRPHYFCCQRINNTIYLHVDNFIIASGNISSIPSISTGSLQIVSNIPYLGIDEIYMSTGSISPDNVKLRFIESSPKIYSQRMIYPEKYQQFQIQCINSQRREFELHQCSLRGVHPDSTYNPLIVIGGEYIGGYGEEYGGPYGIYL